MDSTKQGNWVFPDFEITRFSIKKEDSSLEKCVEFRTHIRKQSEEDGKWYLIPVIEKLYNIQDEDECLKKFISSCYTVSLFFKLDSTSLKHYFDIRGYHLNKLDEFQGTEMMRLRLDYSMPKRLVLNEYPNEDEH